MKLTDLRVRINVHKIADKFTSSEVLEHTCEEFAEASAALIQYYRALGTMDKKLSERSEHVTEEIADALIMLEQLLHKNPWMRSEVEAWMVRKVKRTFEREGIEEMIPMEEDK